MHRLYVKAIDRLAIGAPRRKTQAARRRLIGMQFRAELAAGKASIADFLTASPRPFFSWAVESQTPRQEASFPR
jgi:hypothetical protein